MIKGIYKTIRSIIFSLTLLVVGLYVLAYTLFSLPFFTNWVKDIATAQLSEFLGGNVEIERLRVYPFNEVNISGLKIYDPEGRKCIEVEDIGAGISLWKLLSRQKIELSYGEIIGLNADIVQYVENGPLNIDFLIQALSSKDDNKEKKAFEMALRNVVLRKSSLSFRRPWLKEKKIGNLDLADLKVTDLAADIIFPKLGNDGVTVDLRRLSLEIPGVASVRQIKLKGKFGKEGLAVENLDIRMPGSRLFIEELSLPLEEGQSFKDALYNGPHELQITDSYITPADFNFLDPVLSSFTERLPLELLVSGNMKKVIIENFDFGSPDVMELSFAATIDNPGEISSAKGKVSDLKLMVMPKVYERVLPSIKTLPPHIMNGLKETGTFSLEGNLEGDMDARSAQGHLILASNAFDIEIEGDLAAKGKNGLEGRGEVKLGNVNPSLFFPNIPLENINAELSGEVDLMPGNPQGTLSLEVSDFEYRGRRYEGLSLNVTKNDDFIDGDILINNAIADLDANFNGDITSEKKSLYLDLDLRSLNLSTITDMKKYNGYVMAAHINLEGEGTGPDDLLGTLNIDNFSFSSPDDSRKLTLKKFNLQSSRDNDFSTITLNSDWVDARAEGDYKFHDMALFLNNLCSSVFPAFILEKNLPEELDADMDFDIFIKKNNTLPDFLNLPMRLLVPVSVSGTISGSENMANLVVDVPYLQQGKDKLVYDTKLLASINGDSGIMDARIQTTMPVKRGDLALDVNLYAHRNSLETDLHWVNTENDTFNGHITIDTDFSKNHLSSVPDIKAIIQPSVLQMGTTLWTMDRSEISFNGESVDIDGLKIWHDNQYVEISGVASQLYEDVVKVNLADIDVDYVFDTLGINYVTFGGVATGEIAGHSLLSRNPVAETESLIIRDFSYNGCLLGTCYARSRWINDEKEIEIGADIFNGDHQIVKGLGGIWLGQDSLSFDLGADKVPVEFVQPFMSAFSSHVGGIATGNVKLYGNFHDIDMTGKIFADSVAVKLDYTNTVYHGSDSVFLYPGRIEIPGFRLYDKDGNSAMLTGELTHNYFHEPAFTFRLSDAHNFLCYDTTSELNPDWYGVLHGTGSALVTGVPGFTDISADMSISDNSTFTFVLNETEYARDYQFLTFSDRRKTEAQKDTVMTANDFKAMLKKSMSNSNSIDRFNIDIRATITPRVLFTLVMDPATGDKITARGKGAMQVKYDSADDEMMMYGQYEIEEGNYNFSLQDILFRDFKIKEGSSISFNGNPLAADLNISATYRVNTNLSDLDKSFSTDRDLNRTNVPVDAVLSVHGNMERPDITFDIELPTLTQDVERKVKSIISTDDMMNRQIIYLLALNRFYTPEYMGTTGGSGELAAVASSTISSQLSNMLGQLTDKVSVAPSFHSDKGDFSDIQVDVALSSRLLNNRLLINGNFGYRDKSTSSTTFVGDFDVEYLLSKNGNLRLKAYNHFNDQNYYLREALTTQGLGVIYRKDFDNWFTFLKKRKKEDKKDDEPSGETEEMSEPSERVTDTADSIKTADTIKEEVKDGFKD